MLALPQETRQQALSLPDPIRRQLEEVERLIRDAGWAALPQVPAVTGHLVGSGGKRIRPLLCLLTARLMAIPPALALRVAAAAELIHTASLLHDDVVDRAELRRGRPSAPRVFGNSLCVLVGDALLARALALLSDLDERAPLQSLGRCVSAMALAEIRQLAQAGRGQASLLGYFRIVRGKTAALFAWCATVGELCPVEHLRALRTFGLRLGTIFQITDDVLDVTGDAGRTGKQRGADLRQGKLTLPLIYACRQQPDLLARIVALSDEREARLSATRSDPTDDLFEEIRRSGGAGRAAAATDVLLTRAHQALEALPPSSWREQLHQLADAAARRQH